MPIAEPGSTSTKENSPLSDYDGFTTPHEPIYQVGVTERYDDIFRGPYHRSMPPKRHLDWVAANLLPHPVPKWPNQDKLSAMFRKLAEGNTCAMIGDRGTGKTQIAAVVFKIWNNKVFYFPAPAMFTMIKSWIELRSEDSLHNMKVLRKVPLLIIDELHETLGTDYDDKTLTSLVDYRYGERLPTLLIANLLPAEFMNRIGSSIVDRMSEGGCVVECNWPSYRGAE